MAHLSQSSFQFDEAQATNIFGNSVTIPAGRHEVAEQGAGSVCVQAEGRAIALSTAEWQRLIVERKARE